MYSGLFYMQFIVFSVFVWYRYAFVFVRVCVFIVEIR